MDFTKPKSNTRSARVARAKRIAVKASAAWNAARAAHCAFRSTVAAWDETKNAFVATVDRADALFEVRQSWQRVLVLQREAENAWAAVRREERT